MNFLSYLGLVVNFIPAVFALLYWKKIAVEVKWFAVMLWFIALNGALGLLGEYLFETNMPFFHAYILVEGMILIKVFSFILPPFLKKGWHSLFIGSFTLAWLYNVVWGDGILGYPTTILGVKGIILILLSITWFIKVQKEKKVQHPVRLFSFWLSTGVLIFFSGNMLLFIFSNYVYQQDQHVFVPIWGVHAILTILLNITYTMAIIWAHKNPTSS